MKVSFFLEPFPIRQNPLEVAYPAHFWTPHAAELRRFGVRTQFLCTEQLARHLGNKDAVTPEGLGFAVKVPLSAEECDRQWVELMRDPIEPSWRPMIEAMLDASQPDAVLTWTINAPLRALCRERRIPVLHQELGPLRAPSSPLYFCDPVGVNGESSIGAVWRYVKSGPWGPRQATELATFKRDAYASGGSTTALREALGLQPHRPVMGVFLQLPRDSNVLAWSRVPGAPGLLSAIQEAVDSRQLQVVVKQHPLATGSVQLPKGFFEVGADVPAGLALDLCDVVATINSSVGFEALLQGKPVYAFGRSAYSGVGATRDVESGAELRERLKVDSFSFTAEEEDAARRLVHFLLFRYFVSEREFLDTGWLLQTVDRFIRLTRRGTSLEDYFSPGTTPTRLREHRAWAAQERRMRRIEHSEQDATAARMELESVRQERDGLDTALARSTAAMHEAARALAGLENSAGVRAIRLLQKAPGVYPTWLAAKRTLGKR